MLAQFSTAELENIIEEFPYFQQAHVLLAKKYQQENHPKFDEQLQLAALYTQDREFLFSIFHETVAVPFKNVPAPIIEKAEEPKQETKEEEEVKILSPLPEEEAVLEEKPVGEVRVEDYLAEEMYEEIPPLLAELPEEEIVVQQKETLPEEKVSREEKEIFLVTENHTYEEWLRAFSKPEVVKQEIQPEVIAPETEKLDKELDQLILSNLPMEEFIEEETHYSKGLEQFIEEQKEKHKPLEVKKAVSENELDPRLVTETIAKIYEMQKKYLKAIQAYEILALKYPEKNDFFAARINYLKNIL